MLQLERPQAIHFEGSRRNLSREESVGYSTQSRDWGNRYRREIQILSAKILNFSYEEVTTCAFLVLFTESD